MPRPSASRNVQPGQASAEVLEEIHSLGPWFHNLHLPDGTQTFPDSPYGDFPGHKWRRIAPHLPADLSGWTALDIGCNAGYYAIELARRGARVTGMDLDPHYLKQAEWARRRFGLEKSLRLERMQVYHLARREETFDLVWFMGVLYHLRHPLLALEMAARKTRRLMVFQTLTSPGEEAVRPREDMTLLQRERMREPGWPAMAFIENRLAGDPTNWWAPNHACVEAMLRSCGLEIAGRPAEEIYLCRPVPGWMPLEGPELRDAQYRAATGLDGGRP